MKITYGFGFVPVMKREREMLQDKSGYNLVPVTTVCLTSSMRKRNRGKMISMNIVLDTTYEKLVTHNVSTNEKSEYMEIWKQLLWISAKNTK